jgi:ATP-dependent Clp protease ATP-binding subunit ClpA
VLSSELEFCLNQAFREARARRHEFLTVEQLLLALLDAPKVREVLSGCGAAPDELAGELRAHIEANTPLMREGEEREVQPTLGFQRVLQRAVFHVQSSGRKEVGVVNVLVAIFSEKQSHSVFLLTRQNITRLDVVHFISHGLARGACQGRNRRRPPVTGSAGEGARAEYATNPMRRHRPGASIH